MERLDLTPFKTAKLRTAEVAFLCGVSRVTAFTWMREHKPANPHHLIHARVRPVLLAVTRALEAKQLPLPDDESAETERTPEGYRVRLEVLRVIKNLLAR